MKEQRRGPLLLTGVPGVGKTTVMRRVAEQLECLRIGGFLTDEIRQGGERRGFRITGFDGSQATLAHVGIHSRHRVGRYGVDVQVLDEMVARCLGPADLSLIDEIGKMECFSGRFIASVTQLLDGEVPLVATVALKGGGFIGEVKARPDVTLWRVTRADRDKMPARILEWIEARAS